MWRGLILFHNCYMNEDGSNELCYVFCDVENHINFVMKEESSRTKLCQKSNNLNLLTLCKKWHIEPHDLLRLIHLSNLMLRFVMQALQVPPFSTVTDPLEPNVPRKFSWRFPYRSKETFLLNKYWQTLGWSSYFCAFRIMYTNGQTL